jgi:mannitol-1-phosphate 5-dehydrogenase
MKRAVHFGAGNIGRGFIAPTLQDNDYTVTFVDVNTGLVTQINEEGQYNVTSISIDGATKEKIKDIKAIDLDDKELLNKALLNADLITTSVGPKYVESIYERVATLDNQKDQIFIAFENMYKASSSASYRINSQNKNLKIIDAVVDKIVPPQPLTSLDVIVETYGSIILDESKKLQPLGVSKIVTYRNYDNEFYKKLWLLNGLHLQLAYYGLANGHTYIDEVLSNKEGREFGDAAIKSLAEAYVLLSNSDEKLDEFSETIINRFSLPEIKDEVTRIARNPEIKFSKNERFEYPLRLLIANNKSVETFSKILNILISGDYPQVEGFSNFKEVVLEKGKSNIYNDFWEIENYIEDYTERLGS